MLAIIAGAWFHYNSLVHELADLKTTVEKQKDKLDIAAQKQAAYEDALLSVNKSATKVNQELQTEREKIAPVQKIFGDHDFANLAKKKPGLITKRMQAATLNEFQKLEEITK